MKVHVETYGCAKNQADSEIMEAQIDDSRHELSDFKKAEVIVLNTCIVKSKTENRMRNRLKELSDSDKEILVAGCMPESLMETVEELAPEAYMLGPSSVGMVTSLLEKLEQDERTLYIGGKKPDKTEFSKKSSNPVRRIVPISEGCTGACTFCITKKARKNLKSYPLEDIVEEVRRGVSQGAREFYICAEDTGCYGFDTGRSLPQLMRSISKIDGDFKVRIGMMNPDNALKVLDGLVKSYKSEKFYNFLHVPVQSGSNSVLEDMNRNYSIEEFEKVVSAFREEIPDLNLATDIIAGFPTESDENFQKTLELLERVKPEVVNVSRYGSRPRTVARRKFKDNPTEIIKERSKKVSKLVHEILKEKKKQLLGERRRILVTEEKEEVSKGRDSSYNQILLDRGEPGDFKEVEITDYEKFYLKAKSV